MCSKVLNGHIILTDTSITTILAPEMTYTPVYTSGDADEDVVGEPVGFVGAAYDAVLRIPVAVLLRRDGAADEGE